ncbi:MAG: ABC transporter permease [Saprospiraceae bacterium]
MLQTYFKLAYRNFIKNKSYAFINLAGLSVGLLSCFLVLAYVQYETGYDKSFSEAERIYQINLLGSFGGEEMRSSGTPPPVGKTLEENLPEITAYTRLYRPGDFVVERNGELFTERAAVAVDTNFLEFFDFPLQVGNAKTCLDNPRSVVITPFSKNKYFGQEEAIGKTIKIDQTDYQVTAVLSEEPTQSTTEFAMLIPTTATPNVKRFDWSWVWLQMEAYVRTKDQLSAEDKLALEAKFPAVIRPHATKAFQRLGQDFAKANEGGNRWEINLKPLADVHLYSAEIFGRMGTLGNIREVYIFSLVGLMILLLAGINFININTAHSADRAKEIGVRKVLGSNRSSLMKQFLAETIFYCLVAAVIAVGAAFLLLPQFNQLIGIELKYADFFTPLMMITAISLPIIVGLLAGSYPALVLANFRRAQVLKSKITNLNNSATSLRSGLIVFQFAISVSLIVCTLIVLKQINFALNSDLGLQKENVLVINNVQRLAQAETFKERLLAYPEVVAATLTTDLPAGNSYGGSYRTEPSADGSVLAKDFSLDSYLVDDNFIETMQIELVAGRNFASKSRNDSATVIVNESMVKTAGWDDPVGQYIIEPAENVRYQVIGVMQDAKMRSFHASVMPFGLFHESSKQYDLGRQYLAIKAKTGQEKQLIAKVEQAWQSQGIAAPFEYNFLDESFNQMYQAEVRLGQVLSVFTIISIIIACLGLFGLIAYNVRQRTREVGIRRVLGASVTSILTLLTKDLLKLVLIGILIAVPIAWYLMQQWLQDFEYRVAMTGSSFVFAGTMAILISVATVGWLSVKAALANPVESLKDE